MRVEQHGHGLVAARRQGVVGCAGPRRSRAVVFTTGETPGPARGLPTTLRMFGTSPASGLLHRRQSRAWRSMQSAVGQRVSVRRRVEGGLTDVLGHLLDVTDDRLDVLSHGEVLALPVGRRDGGQGGAAGDPSAGAGRCRRSRPTTCSGSAGPAGRRASTEHARRLGAARARRHHRPGQLGDGGGRPRACRWRRRCDAVAHWYAARGLPPLLQLPLADPANRAMADAGWARLHVTVVQVAPIGRLLAGPCRSRPAGGRRADAVGRLARR